ncbi:MAG: hypothetical protein NC517_06525 [Firmicutes bacterium]|nr:hypothetical protein [Bacillota bacterium]
MESKRKVTWESQSGGSWTEKIGAVIAEIPAGESAIAYVPETVKKSHIKFKDVSEIDRVLVAVPAGKDGQIAHYYCPAKSVLIMQGNEL